MEFMMNADEIERVEIWVVELKLLLRGEEGGGIRERW
jgi:hypothetical protein